MPHKKAKRSIRDTATTARGYDNPPVASTSTLKGSNKGKGPAAHDLDAFGGRNDLGGLSKTVYRVLNSVAVREEYNANKKKRQREEEDKAAGKKKGGVKGKPLEPLPYESLRSFNRRVETALRPEIDQAIKASKVTNKKNTAKKPKLVDPSAAGDAEIAAGRKVSKVGIDPHVPPMKPAKIRTGPTEFAPVSQIKSILDIAMAPPTLKQQRKITVGATTDPLPSHRMPVSESIKRAMEVEREKAVINYRILKEKREAAQRAEQGIKE